MFNGTVRAMSYRSIKAGFYACISVFMPDNYTGTHVKLVNVLYATSKSQCLQADKTSGPEKYIRKQQL